MTGTVASAMLTAWLPVSAGSSPAAAATPVNDAFADAAAFSVALPTTGWEGATKRLSGTNVEATRQAGEPKPSCATSSAKSVWFKVKPARSGVLRLNTAGSTYDTVLAVYRNSTLASLSRVRCANVGGGTESLNVSVKAGTTYAVQLSGTGATSSGTYKLAARLRYFGPGYWPDGSWRPYKSSSVFNRAVPANPTLAPNSAQIIDRIIDNVPYGTPAGGIARRDRPGHFVVHTDGTSGEPTYFSPPPSSAATTTYTLHCTYSVKWGRCPVEGKQVRIPPGARTEGDRTAADTSASPDPNAYFNQPDAHLTVVDQWAGVEYDLWQLHTNPVPAATGTLSFTYGGVTQWNGTGMSDGTAGTAAHFGSLAGRVRAEELKAGKIDHTLFIGVDCDNGTVVAPAMGKGRPCSQVSLPGGAKMSNVNAPPMGSRLWLDMPVSDINGLNVPAWKKVILRALAKYGAFIGETGSDGYFSVEMESGNQYTSHGKADPWIGWAKANSWPLMQADAGYPFERYHGDWSLNADGINWKTQVWSKLRVVDPCVTTQSC